MSAEDANYVYCTSCGYGITYAAHKQLRYPMACPRCLSGFQFGTPHKSGATHIRIDGHRVFMHDRLCDTKTSYIVKICGDICENYEGKPSLPAIAPGWPDDAPIPIADLEWLPPVVDVTVKFEE